MFLSHDCMHTGSEGARCVVRVQHQRLHREREASGVDRIVLDRWVSMSCLYFVSLCGGCWYIGFAVCIRV